MATGTAPAKSPLHNFPLTYLKWASKQDHPPRCRRSPLSPPRPRRNPEQDIEPEPVNDTEKPTWNLRPRRAPPALSKPGGSANANGGGNGNGTGVEDSGNGGPKSTRVAGGGTGGGEKRKFWIALSRDEIEEDIYSMTGAKPSRRPRKRPKIVQKQLDIVFPGLWMVGVSPESYRGLDPPLKR